MIGALLHRTWSGGRGAGLPRVLWLLLAILAGPAPVAGAAAPGGELLARIVGRVLSEDTGDPIVAATVRIQGTERQALTDLEGRFVLDRVLPGEYRLVVEHVAHATVTIPLLVDDPDAVYQVEVRMATEAIPLEPFVIEVLRPSVQAGVMERIAWTETTGLGAVFSRDAILASGSIRLSHLLGTLPGVQVRAVSGRTGGGDIRLLPTVDCAPSLYVDGIPTPLHGAGLDDLISISEVETMEVYRRLSQIPGEFADDTARRCGVIVVSTRRGWQQGEPFGWRRMLSLAGFVAISYALAILGT